MPAPIMPVGMEAPAEEEEEEEPAAAADEAAAWLLPALVVLAPVVCGLLVVLCDVTAAVALEVELEEPLMMVELPVEFAAPVGWMR